MSTTDAVDLEGSKHAHLFSFSGTYQNVLLKETNLLQCNLICVSAAYKSGDDVAQICQ